MRWEKLGRVFGPTDRSLSWAKHSALQPTPILLEDRVRVYCGFRDVNGKSRVGFVDLDPDNPMHVMGVSDAPALDLGDPMTFDQDGVVPCAIVKRGERLFLYYAGYLLCEKVRFQAFGGLAVSEDEGKTFNRHAKYPVLGPTEEATLFRALHSIMPEGGKWRVWYGAGSRFEQGKTKTLPVYNIRYMESTDGITFPREGSVAIDISGEEHRVGRPYVVKIANNYIMFFGSGSEQSPYTLMYATSPDGISWTRQGAIDGLDLSPSGWDSQMMAYPAVLTARGQTYMFYNGNEYGRDGFGCARLVSWETV